MNKDESPSNAHTEVAPTHHEHEEDASEEEIPPKLLLVNANALTALSTSALPGTVVSFVSLLKSDHQCSSVNKMGRSFWFAICDCKVPNRTACNFTIGHWNEHKNLMGHMKSLMNKKGVNDLKRRKKTGEKLT
eukprot:15359682-Ditylum_brightwellii.AAC.1